MSKPFINEQPLLVFPSLAEAVGLNESIVLCELHRRADNKGGVVCNALDLREWFPFWDDEQIEAHLKSLESGRLVCLEFNPADPSILFIAVLAGARS